jgi:molybdopterin molybdotransferase
MERPEPRLKVTPTEAARSILQTIHVLPTEHVRITDALGLVAAETVASPIDLPYWDNSAMDGYAVQSNDVRGKCPTELQVIEHIPAGTFPSKQVSSGQCARIFTGAPLPKGSDGVVRQEDTIPLDDDRVRITEDRDAGRNIRRRGEDIVRNAVLVDKGTELAPAQIGILASVARDQVLVHRRPRVAILASGDEIADLDERAAILEGRKVASSNTYTLETLVKQAGGHPTMLGIARDDPGDLKARLAGAAEADLLITSGAVSVGDHDHLRSVLQELGAEIRFWRIRMRPGAPVAFGLWNGLPWIGLPGNPVSTMVTFELFVRPSIRAMLGHLACFRQTVTVRTADIINLPARLTHFLRAVVHEQNGALTARLTGPQGSGILTSMAMANALLIVPEGQREVAAGSTLRAMLLDEVRHVEEVPF